MMKITKRQCIKNFKYLLKENMKRENNIRDVNVMTQKTISLQSKNLFVYTYVNYVCIWCLFLINSSI